MVMPTMSSNLLSNRTRLGQKETRQLGYFASKLNKSLNQIHEIRIDVVNSKAKNDTHEQNSRYD